MAYDSKEWRRVQYRGRWLPGIREHIERPGRWLLIVEVKGTRRRKIVTLEGDRREVVPELVRRYSELRADLIEGYYLEPKTFDDLFKGMMRTRPATRWKRQQEGIYRNHIAPKLGAVNVRDIRPGDIDALAVGLLHLKPRTQKAVLDIVRATMQRAIDARLIKVSPVEARHRVQVKALEQKRIVIDAVQTYRRVHAAIMRTFAADPVLRSVFLLGLYGRRKTEALRLCWEDIDMANGSYIVRAENSKVRQDMAFPLPDEVAAALREIGPKPSGFCFLNPATRRPFTNIQRYIERVREASGWPGFMFHAMRNLLASALYAEGVSAANLSAVLGHTRPETLARYLSMQRLESCRIVNETAADVLGRGTA